MGKPIDWKKKFKNKKCQLCEKKTREQLHFMVGGCFTYAHESCMQIVRNYTELLSKWKILMKKIKYEWQKQKVGGR